MDRHYIALTPFGKWVSGRVRLLATGGRASSGVKHGGYIRNDAYATAAIARLRHAVGHEVGMDPDIFEWTMPDTDDPDVTGPVDRYRDEPTPQERAAHAAVTLYAVQQQSIHDMPMHTDEDISLGRAVGRMAYGNFNETGIRRLFDQLQTSGSWKELIRHTLSMVKLLKRERIALNYGLLAQDLMALQSDRDRANAVRMRWGRDFQSAYRHRQLEDGKTQS